MDEVLELLLEQNQLLSDLLGAVNSLTAAVLACAALTGAALALSTGDSLSSLSYLNDTYIPTVVAQGTKAADEKLIQAYQAASQKLDEGEFLDVLRIPFEQAVQMVLDGQILDSKTQIGILKLHALRMQKTK